MVQPWTRSGTMSEPEPEPEAEHIPGITPDAMLQPMQPGMNEGARNEPVGAEALPGHNIRVIMTAALLETWSPDQLKLLCTRGFALLPQAHVAIICCPRSQPYCICNQMLHCQEDLDDDELPLRWECSRCNAWLTSTVSWQQIVQTHFGHKCSRGTQGTSAHR